jgi:REP element-mobilizing transposase RayT
MNLSGVGLVEERNPTVHIFDDNAIYENNMVMTMRYRRARTKGGTYFFTVTTFKREKILIEPENVKILHEAFRYVMEKHAFTIDAFVLLPDDLHCIYGHCHKTTVISQRDRGL